MKDHLLHIICLMKIVEDMDDISRKEYMQAAEGGLDMSYVKKMMNCFDEAALENALRLKEKRCEAGLDTRVSVMSLNPGYASHFLKPFFAVKADDVINIETNRTTWMNPSETAGVLAAEIKKRRKDGCQTIIFAGKQAPPLNSGLVPVYIAEELGLMMLQEVFDINYEDGKLIAARTAGNSRELYRMDGAAEIVFGSARYSYLRVPTLREKMKYKNRTPEIVSYKIKDTIGPPRLVCPIRETECEFITYDREEEGARRILEQFLQ